MSEKYKDTPIGWWNVTKPLEEFLNEKVDSSTGWLIVLCDEHGLEKT